MVVEGGGRKRGKGRVGEGGRGCVRVCGRGVAGKLKDLTRVRRKK